ncbi:hypothetical protein OS493_022912 [Desmophyllum pertusum]|uniref:Uncharacterized protein n=1 Tax=Desmophyllum pertusum TaxID=174260 RepID=A0A9W9ZNZ5_9CNID|nr:hypothetical protein OS493_022912 [Desmophyllum pertusum]
MSYFLAQLHKLGFPFIARFVHISCKSLASRTNMALEQVSSTKTFGGFQKVFKHKSSELQCDMNFGSLCPSFRQKKGKFRFYIGYQV